MGAIDHSPVKLRLTRKLPLTQNVLQLDLGPAEGTRLPAWDPGAHVELRLPSGRIRHYSLCGDPRSRETYTVVVRREIDGDGGSTEIHDSLDIGEELYSSHPRNHFTLSEAPDYLLIAGGIGITPLKSMAEELDRRGAAWRLVYIGRSRQSMAFADVLTELYPGRVSVVPADEQDLPDLEQLAKSLPPQTHVYCCGPPRMLAVVSKACDEAGIADRLHIERFSAGENSTADLGGRAFEVELQDSGVTVSVAEDQSILEAVRSVRSDVPSSCQEGYCGTCETRVIAGRPDHRGSLMSPEEHDEEGTMLICVGRSRSDKLILDL